MLALHSIQTGAIPPDRRWDNVLRARTVAAGGAGATSTLTRMANAGSVKQGPSLCTHFPCYAIVPRRANPGVRVMDRLQQASARMSSARRHLFALHPDGDPRTLEAALLDVEVGLAALGDLPLPAPRARECVTALRSALAAPPADRGLLYAAIDDLASFLFWEEMYRSS
jgi:hypothetical protein